MADATLVRREAGALVVETRNRALVVLGGGALLWAVQVVNFLVGGRLMGLGITPRTLSGLLGIAFAPFIHVGLAHLMANTLPFLVLGFLATSRRLMDFFVVSFSAALVGGLGTWLLGTPGTIHMGASSLIFGYMGFLVGRGIFERRAGSILISLLALFLFGGMLWGLLPFLAPGVSWTGHFFGFLGGLIPARILGKAISRPRR